MKTIIVMLNLVVLLTLNSCYRQECSGTDTSGNRVTYEAYDCTDQTQAPSNVRPSTGGASGTYTDPIADPSVTHSGLVDFYVKDPSLDDKKAYPQGAAILADANQDGSVDLDGSVPNHNFIVVEGVVQDPPVTGLWYKDYIITSKSISGWQQGKKVSANFSNKPYGYQGDPRNCPTNADGSYMISPGAIRYYGMH